VPFDASLYTRAEAIRKATDAGDFSMRRLLRWWRAPFWLLALVTGAKSFADNPILGSLRLNRAGLHVWRLRSAHRLAAWRRARLAHLIPTNLKAEFDRDGFVAVPEVLTAEEFENLRSAILRADLECRSHQQGDTITTRMPVGPELLGRVPSLAALIQCPRWKGIMAYVASTRAEPLYYVQAIAGGVADGPADPQLELHSDTFHPSLKAWLFLTDVPGDGRPLSYVAGSHRLTRQRLAWEKQRSIEIATADRLSQRGSLRVKPEELDALGLPQPTHFAVPANTLVVADTCGFHARAPSDRRTLRIEIWAYCRRSPFLPWTGVDPLSWRPIASRRGEWLARIVDWLDRRGWMKQQWRSAGPWRDAIRTQSSSTCRIVGTATAHQIAPNAATAAVSTKALS
jgi:hypothetical protein